MKRLGLALMLLSVPVRTLCSARAGGFQPASTNVWDAPYPRVDGTGRVEVRLKAPEATKVRLNFWSGPKIDMVKQPDGVWSVITEPLVPGLHYYTLIVDGVEMADTGSRAFFGGSKYASAVEVPEPGSTLLLDPGRASRTGARGLVLLEGHRDVAPRAGLHAARVRRADETALPSALPAARRRRGRDRLGAPGTRQRDPRQRDRREAREADARRDGVRLREACGPAGVPTWPVRASDRRSSARPCRT